MAADLLKLVPEAHAERHRWMGIILRASIAYQIRTMRLMREWTQKELAKRSGLSIPTISCLEDPAAVDPQISTLQAIASAFDVALLVKFSSWTEFVETMIGMIPPNEFSHDSFEGIVGEQNEEEAR